MAVPVIMPRQGQSVETCIITRWFKKKGERVEAGDLLFSYETDKAAFDEESPVSGNLLENFFEEGDEVPVLCNVCVIGKEGENSEEFRPEGTGATEQPLAKKKEHVSFAERVTEPETSLPEQSTGNTGKQSISPRAGKKVKELGLTIPTLKGTGPDGRIIERDVIRAAEIQPHITPLARKKMEMDQLSYNPANFSRRDRVTAKDLVHTGTGEYEEIRLSRVRKIVANGMFRSLSQSAQLTHHLGADARRILNLRSKIKEWSAKGKAVNITLNDMVCYATVKALKVHPEANAHFREDFIRQFHPVHLGFAVDTERGLMVPVLKNAQDFSLPEFSVELKRLAEQCRTGKIDPDLLSPEAATFTITNLGIYGVEMFTPILNLPQAGILGVNTIVHRPTDIGNGVIAFVPYIGLSLTYDHRALDGAPASRFLKTIKEEIEHFDPVL